jgi:hypothetical protein
MSAEREEEFEIKLIELLSGHLEQLSRAEIKAAFGKRCPEPQRLLVVLMRMVEAELLEVTDRVLESETGGIKRIPVYSLPLGRARTTPRPRAGAV